MVSHHGGQLIVPDEAQELVQHQLRHLRLRVRQAASHQLTISEIQAGLVREEKKKQSIQKMVVSICMATLEKRM